MNTPHERDAALDALLSQLRLQPIADEGFSDRVMAALPARRPPQTYSRPLFIAAIVIGSLLALWNMADAELLQAAAQEWQSGSLGLSAALLLGTLLTLATGLAGWAISEG